MLFPEYLTSRDKSLEIAAHVIRWLVVEETRDGLIAELAKLKARVGHGGASRIAADYILGELAKRPSAAAAPALPARHDRRLQRRRRGVARASARDSAFGAVARHSAQVS